MTTTEVHPVDQMLPTPRLLALGLQHVLVMYAGAIAVPLIIGRALKLAPEQVALLINADLLACGIVTVIQSLGVTPLFGIKLPVMMGVTFAAVGPMLAIANDASLGEPTARLLTIFGSAIAAGVFTMLVAPVLSFLLPLFPPVVTGSVILMIGISLMRIGVNWAAGAPVASIPSYGDLFNLGMAGLVLVTILLITRFVRGFFGNIAVLLGIILGCLVAYFAFDAMSLKKVGEASWFAVVYPLQFGVPQFHWIHILTMCIVMIVVMIESAGMFLALSDMTGKKLGPDDMTRGLRTDGLGTLIGGLMNTFPYTSFSQNVGLVGVTGVRSRWVTVTGGAIMILMGLVPAVRAGRGGRGDVRHGGGDRHPHPVRRRLQDHPVQSLHRRHRGRLRPHSAGRARLLQEARHHRAGVRPDLRLGNPAHRVHSGAAEPVLQRGRQPRGRGRGGAAHHPGQRIK
jgi:NCS2 family nucleobase:cation symporter-2